MANKKVPANQTPIPGYEVKVTGEYISLNMDTGKKYPKHFSAEVFYFPEVVTYADGVKKEEWVEDGKARHKVVADIKKANASRVALHLIRRYYLEHRLREKHADFAGVRKCEIFSKKRVDISGKAEVQDVGNMDIQDMSWSQLMQYVTLNNLNIFLKAYSDLGEAKNAVIRSAEQKRKDDMAAGQAAAPSRDEINLTPADEFGVSEDKDKLADLI